MREPFAIGSLLTRWLGDPDLELVAMTLEGGFKIWVMAVDGWGDFGRGGAMEICGLLLAPSRGDWAVVTELVGGSNEEGKICGELGEDAEAWGLGILARMAASEEDGCGVGKSLWIAEGTSGGKMKAGAPLTVTGGGDIFPRAIIVDFGVERGAVSAAKGLPTR